MLTYPFGLVISWFSLAIEFLHLCRPPKEVKIDMYDNDKGCWFLGYALVDLGMPIKKLS